MQLITLKGKKHVLLAMLFFTLLILLQSAPVLLSNTEPSIYAIPTPTPKIADPSPEPTDVNVLTPSGRSKLPSINREPTSTEYLNQGLGTDDVDCDGVQNQDDNCIFVYNPKQQKTGSGELGNACNRALRNSRERDLRCDRDADGIYDEKDNCPSVFNPRQKDRDRDRTGDACEKTRKIRNPAKECD